MRLQRLPTTVPLLALGLHGRPDMAVRFGGNVYLFEFKVVEMEPEGAAMAQLREKDYAAKYRSGEGEVFLVGVEFSRETRNVVGFEVGRGHDRAGWAATLTPPRP